MRSLELWKLKNTTKISISQAKWQRGCNCDLTGLVPGDRTNLAAGRGGVAAARYTLYPAAPPQLKRKKPLPGRERLFGIFLSRTKLLRYPAGGNLRFHGHGCFVAQLPGRFAATLAREHQAADGYHRGADERGPAQLGHFAQARYP